MWDDPIMIKHHNISIWQYGFRPNESGHETVQQELALPVWAPASTKTGSLAVLLSEGKAQTSQTTKTPPVQKVLSSFSLRALSSGCWIWSLEKLFHRTKNENTIEYQKNHLRHRYGLLKQPIFTSSSPSQQLHNLPSCLCKNFVWKNPA